MNKKTVFSNLALIVVFLSLAGCGIIYTHTTRPLDLNQNETLVGGEAKKGDVKHIKYEIVDVRWDSNAIGDIAKRNGLDQVYYADMEVFSIVGIWSQYTVHIYGH